MLLFIGFKEIAICSIKSLASHPQSFGRGDCFYLYQKVFVKRGTTLDLTRPWLWHWLIWLVLDGIHTKTEARIDQLCRCREAQNNYSIKKTHFKIVSSPETVKVRITHRRRSVKKYEIPCMLRLKNSFQATRSLDGPRFGSQQACFNYR